jgi:hypothetical protein
MKTVDELVSEWTEAEREQFKDLIEECRERERTLIENSRRTRESLFELTQSLSYLVSKSRELSETANKVGDDLLGIYLWLYRDKMPAA